MAHMIGGFDVAVSLPTFPLCPRRQEAYTSHGASHICPPPDCIELGYRNIDEAGKHVTECIDHMGTRLKFEGQNHSPHQNGDDSVSVVSSKHPNMPQLVRLPGRKMRFRTSSGSSSSDLMGSEDPGLIARLTKHLQVSQQNALFQRRRPLQDAPRKSSRDSIGPSSSEDGGLAGMSRLSIREISRRSSKSSNAKLPNSTQKPEFRPTVPPVEVEYDRFCAKTKKAKCYRIIDCLGTISDKWTNSAEETKLSMLSALTVFALRGFGTFTTRCGAGVYVSELESTLKRHPLSSKPMIWITGIKRPPTNRLATGIANISWGCSDTRFAEDSCLLLCDPPVK